MSCNNCGSCKRPRCWRCCGSLARATSPLPGGFVARRFTKDGLLGDMLKEDELNKIAATIQSEFDKREGADDAGFADDVAAQYEVLADIYRQENLRGLEYLALRDALDFTAVDEALGYFTPTKANLEKIKARYDEIRHQFEPDVD